VTLSRNPKAVYHRAWYAHRKAKGECVRCGSKPLKTMTRCAECTQILKLKCALRKGGS
jgi:hypothetical protein